MPQPAWLRGLTNCLQYIVDDADDIEVEAGEVKVGELRPRAFPALQKALSDEQVLSFGWMALADLAVWPQLTVTEAQELAQSIHQLKPALPVRTATGQSLRDAGYRAAASTVAFIGQAQARLRQPAARPPDFELIRVSINALAHFRKDKKLFWQQWLRRTIEPAAVSTPEQACAYAVAGLQATIGLPVRFEYEATRARVRGATANDGPFSITAVTPRQGGRVVANLAQIANTTPVKRKINATLTPAVTLDPYRMGYFLRTVCLAELLDDVHVGYFDSVTCTNTSTNETWTYAAT
jgi:hypothetical protein